MKYFLVLVLAVVGVLAAPRADDEDTVTKIQNAVKAVWALIPEPALDIHGTDGNIDLGFEKLAFSSYDIVLSGINNLDISSMVYNEETGQIEYEWVLPSVEADVKFDLTLSGILDAENNPVVKVVLSNIKFTGYIVVVPDSSPLQLSDLSLLISLDSAEVSLKGILNDAALDEKLEGILNKQLPTLVSDISALLQPTLAPVIKTLINIAIRLLD